MKKFLITTLLTGSLLLAACQGDVLKSDSAKKNLEDKGYTVEVYAFEEAKARIQNLNYEGYTFNDAIFAKKGQDKDTDLVLAFYFKNSKDAEKFCKDNNNDNLAKMNTYLEKNLGENLEPRVGVHNNVAYLASVTSFAVALPDAL